MRSMTRAACAATVGFGLSLGASAGLAQALFEGEDAGFPAPEGDPSILADGAKLMKVFDDGCVLTEGVAAGHDGFMYFSDITFTSLCKDESGTYLQAGNIWKYDPQTGEATVWRSPSGMSNGLKFDKDGNLLAALGADYGGRMLVRTDMATGRTYILTGLFEGQPYNALNDITIDEQERIYFSDPRYLGHEPMRAENRPGIAVYNPEGKELAFISTGEELPTNVGFGRGEESDVLYVTSGKSLYKIKMAKDGYQLPE